MDKHYKQMDALPDGWEAWDAVPQDGPAVFVIDTVVLEQQQALHGRWLDLSAGQTAAEAALRDLLQRPIDGGWAIVDQVGLGPRMAPETIAAEELQRLPDELRAEDGP